VVGARVGLTVGLTVGVTVGLLVGIIVGSGDWPLTDNASEAKSAKETNIQKR